MTSLPDTWVVLPAELAAETPVRADEVLLLRARAGERRALREIYERHAPSVQRFLRDLLRDGPAAADATQETFARAFRRLATVRDTERLRGWLFGIARNVSLEHRKTRRRDERAGTIVGDLPLAIGDVERETPEATLLGREAAEVLDGALGRIPEERRAALLLRVDHGLAYEEIAELCGWSLAKVKVEIHRARASLREALGRYGGGGS